MSKIKKIKINNQIIYDFKKYTTQKKQRLYIERISESGIAKGVDGRYFKLFKIKSTFNFDLAKNLVKNYNLRITLYKIDSETFLLVENTFDRFEIAESNFNELENLLKHQVRNERIELHSVNGNELINLINTTYLLNSKTESLQLNEKDIEKLFLFNYEKTDLNYLKKDFNVYETLFVQKFTLQNKIDGWVKEFLMHKEYIKFLKIELSYMDTKDHSNLMNECYLDANTKSNLIDDVDVYDFSYKSKNIESKITEEKYLLSLSFVLKDSSETELKNRIEAIDVSFNYAGAILGKFYEVVANNKILEFVPIESEKIKKSYERVVDEPIAKTIINKLYKGDL